MNWPLPGKTAQILGVGSQSESYTSALQKAGDMKDLSLIEILIYIGILGILAAVVIPNLSRLLEW